MRVERSACAIASQWDKTRDFSIVYENIRSRTDTLSLSREEAMTRVMKGSLVLLCLIGNIYCSSGYRISELYRVLNITCYGEGELTKICDTPAPSTEKKV